MKMNNIHTGSQDLIFHIVTNNWKSDRDLKTKTFEDLGKKNTSKATNQLKQKADNKRTRDNKRIKAGYDKNPTKFGRRQRVCLVYAEKRNCIGI